MTFTPEPTVELLNAFARPYENAVATARTCYSAKGLVRVADVSGDELVEPEQRAERGRRRDALAASIYRAGHHTTLQHAHFQFGLSGVSRLFIWSFLHSHPFYNSEQVSQRYVKVESGAYVVPPLSGEARELYITICDGLQKTYRRLIKVLMPVAEAEFFRRFPARARRPDDWQGPIRKKAQEVARYVLPLSTQAYLYHTVSALTLLRYQRMRHVGEAPEEQELVIGRMVDAVLRHDPLMAKLLEDPLPLAETPEGRWLAEGAPGRASRDFLHEFDGDLAGHTSQLIAYKPNSEELLASAVREVLGVPRAQLSDDEAIALVLGTGSRPYMASALNLQPHSPLMRALLHVSYTFRKRLSHTADSQNQRHRLVPGSRPLLATHLADEPDYVTPALVKVDAEASSLYEQAMTRLWDDAARLRRLGTPETTLLYVMPNALAVRFTESGDLFGLHHKLVSRLCYNAQEEIFAASLDEARQIAAVHPRIGAHLLAPCALRLQSGETPYCPEGERYCGVRVWRLGIQEYERLI
ncbi:MAG: FAD-dependent thymidylate synthase [Planctomycetota bacterium]